MLYLLKKDFKELFANRKRIVIVFIVLIILIIGTYSNMQKQNHNSPSLDKMIRIGVVDQDSSIYSKLLLEYFSESETYLTYINVIQGKKDEIEEAFYDGDLDVCLEIPKDFAENMIHLEHLPIKVMINAADTTKAILIKNILESYEKYISAVELNCVALYDIMSLSGLDREFVNKKNIEISYDLIFTALGKDKFFSFHETGDFPSTSSVNYYIYAILSMVLIYSGLYVGFQMMGERRQGTFVRLRTVGMPIWAILLEKLIFSTVIIFILIFMTYLIPNLLGGNGMDSKVGFVYLGSTLFCVSFALLLGGIFKKLQNYMIVGNFICFLFSIIGGSIIPIMYLPTELVHLSKFTPNYWFIKMMILMQRGMDKGLLQIILLGLLLCTFIFFLTSNIVFHREDMGYEE